MHVKAYLYRVFALTQADQSQADQSQAVTHALRVVL